MTTPHPERLVLHPRMVAELRARKSMLWAIPLMLLAVTILVLVPALQQLAERGVDWGAVGTALMKKIHADPWGGLFHGFVLIAVLGHFAYLWFVQLRERLVLTRTGIEFHSPLPAWVPWLPKSWSLDWGRVTGVALHPSKLGPAPPLIALEIAAHGRKHRLFPYRWVDPIQFQPPPLWNPQWRNRRLSAEALTALIDESPLLRYVAAALPHLKVQWPSTLSRAPYAIEKNRTALAVTSAFFLLVGYALLDGAFLGNETYAGRPPVYAFAAIGAVVMLFSAQWMMRSRVPLAESAIIAMLAGAAAGGAAYPGLLRANALTDTEGLKPYEYELVGGATLRPLTEELPVLHFPRYSDYWAHFPKGSVHVFELRHGRLGFYQLNLAPVEQAMKVFYRKQVR